ncbi:MAG: hypothetical protein ACRDZU_08320 [Acidimicrobiales bacterium]
MTARRVARSMRLAGLLLLLSSLPAAPSVAQDAGDDLVGYDAVANGMGFTVSPRIPALLPVEVPIEATISLATATLSSGGQGFGRASTFFPGTLTAGIRPLIEIATGTRLPLPDYPIVVESREFEPAKHNDQPGITMSTDVDPDRALAIADAGGIGVPQVFGVHSSRTVSSALVRNGTVSATSTSTVEGVDLGTVKIDSIVSTSTVTTDATTAVCTGDVVVDGVTVNGQAATLDDEGLHVDGEPALPLGSLGDVLQPDLGATRLGVRLLGGTDSCAGASGSQSTGGVLVSIPLPEAGAIPPGGRLDVILASTSASAGASTLAPFEPPLVDLPPLLGDVVPRLPGPIFGGSLDPVALPPTATPPSRPAAPSGPGFTTEPVAYSFAGVPAPLIVGLFLLALPAGRRIRRYMERILALLEPT